MKYWFEGQMEPTDKTKQCSECGKYMSSPALVFVEFEVLLGNQFDEHNCHPHETGRALCHKCGKYKLV